MQLRKLNFFEGNILTLLRSRLAWSIDGDFNGFGIGGNLAWI